MQNSASHLLFALLLLSAGCGKGSEAAPRQTPAPPASAARKAPSGPPVFDAPDEKTASSMPDRSMTELGNVELVIEETDRGDLTVGGDAAAESSLTALSLKVKVTSRQESPRILVEARRFYIQTDTGQRIPARPTSAKDPSIRPTYLQAGSSVSGWITFEVPRSATSFQLRSDIRNPPIQIPVSF